MTEAIADRDSLTHRLRAWILLRNITLGKPWAAEE